MSAVGTFVSRDKKGGSNTFGGNFLTGVGRESREVTLKKAKTKIISLTQQLRLRQDHVDMSFHFYKMALGRGMTRGRKNVHVIAACVYITCRIESTGHMLIDISDVLEVDVYQIGRVYLKLIQELCINIPTMDPCLFVMRYAYKLEFGDSTHEVSQTALRLLSRMKKDWIHFGRRPSGLCGAALLLASRLHEFNRSFEDILKVVKVHESTLRKRLNEFGQTAASELTLDEFFEVDLDAMEEEMDPPCFTKGREKDLGLLDSDGKMTTILNEMKRLEEKIEKELEDRRASVKKSRLRTPSCSSSVDSFSWSSSSSDSEFEQVKTRAQEALDEFLEAETIGIIDECLKTPSPKTGSSGLPLDSILMPPPSPRTLKPANRVNTPKKVRCTPCSPGLGLMNTVDEYLRSGGDCKGVEEEPTEDFVGHELDLTGIDEDEIESFLLSPEEVKKKTKLWLKVNKEYLQDQEDKRKKKAEEREEMIKQGLDPDRKKKVYRKRKHRQSGTAVEAIEKMAIEKKISTKINYDILKKLNVVNQQSDSNEMYKSPSKDDVSTPVTLVISSPEIKKVKNLPSGVMGISKNMKMDKKPKLVSRCVPKKKIEYG